jgi:hypothetical protein
MRVDPAWKTNTAFGSPPPSSVRGTGPLIASPEADV